MDFEKACDTATRKVLADATPEQAITTIDYALRRMSVPVETFVLARVAAELWPDNERLQELLEKAKEGL